jgi:hypothetical protein
VELPQLSLKVIDQSSECSPSGPPSLISTLMSSPAVGEAGLLACEAYHQKRMPLKLLQSCDTARLSLKPP